MNVPDNIIEMTRIKINKTKATFMGRSPRHTKIGHPEDARKTCLQNKLQLTMLSFFPNRNIKIFVEKQQKKKTQSWSKVPSIRLPSCDLI
jgi:hypothetical protein